MLEMIFSAGLIALLRICDVSLGTIRTIFVVQSKKYHAALAGFFEVLIWIYAMSYIVDRMDNTLNLLGYATGFSLGTILGVTIEQKLGLGHLQVNLISREKSLNIAEALRASNHGVTLLPGSGANGEVSILFTIINKKNLNKIKNLVHKIDPEVFINIQPASPTRGYMHAGRK
ncbi:MAG: DUF2179 domain-containing protein [Ignavibacteriae bacterium]|nr:DUF2179 domain-containing protein [Ignavibacteriota bacterium]